MTWVDDTQAFTVPNAVGNTRSAVESLAAVPVDTDDSFLEDRRNAFRKAGIAASSLAFLPMFPSLSVAEDEAPGMGTSPDSPIVVIGAGGKVIYTYRGPGWPATLFHHWLVSHLHSYVFDRLDTTNICVGRLHRMT